MVWDGDERVVLRRVWRRAVVVGDRSLYIRLWGVRGVVMMSRVEFWLWD
jgi:hypothetical protein